MLFSRSVMSNSLWPHGLQHTRLPCPSTSPRACSNSCPLYMCVHAYMYVHPSSCPSSRRRKVEKPVKKLLQYSKWEVMMGYTWGVAVKVERLCKWTYSLRFFSDILLFYQGKKVEFYKARSLVHVGISPCSNITQWFIPSESSLVGITYNHCFLNVRPNIISVLWFSVGNKIHLNMLMLIVYFVPALCWFLPPCMCSFYFIFNF